MSNRQTIIALALVIAFGGPVSADNPRGRTVVSIRGDKFLINGRPTYEGRTWKGARVEGLLLNSPDGAGDLRRPEPRDRGDVGLPRHRPLGPRAEHPRVPRRHARVAAARAARLHAQPAGRQPAGLLARDASPGTTRPSTADGALRPEYMDRLGRILDRADELGMVVDPRLFYFGQDERLKDEAAVIRAVDDADRLAPRPGLHATS